MQNKKLDIVTIGKRIKKQRILLGYTREKLAEMTDITPRFCYDIELGLKNMSTETLTKLAAALNVPIDFLIFGDRVRSDVYNPIISLVETCPPDKLSHLETIVSHYIQAVKGDISH